MQEDRSVSYAIRSDKLKVVARIPETCFARIPETGFVRLPQVLSVFPVSRSTWWEGVKYGAYPQPVKLGGNTTAWRATDIRALLDTEPTLIAERLKAAREAAKNKKAA